MDLLMGSVSFGFSTLTALATFYFWIVKARQERPWLRVCKAEPQITGYARGSCDDPIRLTFEVKTIVANYSSMPNALLGVRAWVRMREGGWQEAETSIDAKTPLPLNLPSLQTARLNLTATVAVPAVPEGTACRNTHETFALYRDRFLAQPVEVRVELSALNDQAFRDVLSQPRAAA